MATLALIYIVLCVCMFDLICMCMYDSYDKYDTFHGLTTNGSKERSGEEGHPDSLGWISLVLLAPLCPGLPLYQAQATSDNNALSTNH